jgi:hydroxymethylglutaryl-CoA reductase (NADPH)
MLKYLNTTPEGFYDFWFGVFLGGSLAGMVGMNGHFANALAATFIACGQDAAQVVNASIGMTLCELTTDGNLSMSLKLPNMIVGTVGGGTTTGTAKECLEILGCAGPDRALKFAEIIGATLLAGEIAIGAAMTNGNFEKAHKKKRSLSTFPAVMQDNGGVQN